MPPSGTISLPKGVILQHFRSDWLAAEKHNFADVPFQNQKLAVRKPRSAHSQHVWEKGCSYDLCICRKPTLHR